MESNPGDGKACKLKAFVALPEALLMPEKISVTVTDLRRKLTFLYFHEIQLLNVNIFVMCEFYISSKIMQSIIQCDGIFMKNEIMIPKPFHFCRMTNYKQVIL